MSRPGEITKLLEELRSGRSDRRDRLVELVYGELRRIAKGRMCAERHGHTLTPTALVHEAYFRLERETARRFTDRNHFFAVAAQAMRRVLVDHARGKRAARRGAEEPAISLDESIAATPATDEQILALDLALGELSRFNPRQCQVVELKFFAGLTETEIAGILGVTRRTVCRDWKMARAWLHATVAGRGRT